MLTLYPIAMSAKDYLDYAARLQTKNGILPETNMTLGQLIDNFYGESYNAYHRKVGGKVSRGGKTMSEQTVKAPAPKETPAALTCRLRQGIGRNGLSPSAGEVEIENVSSSAIEIEVTMHPLQYLALVITDASGNLVPAVPYGNIFSPREVPYLFRLAPGETYKHNVSLLGTVPEEKKLPGSYTVRAVYDYNGMKAVSEPLRVQLPAKGS